MATRKSAMATSHAQKPHKPLRTKHEVIHRPYQNPNHAETTYSTRGRIRDIQRRLRLENSRAKQPVEYHLHEERRTKEARLPADKYRDYERELIELLRDEAIKEAEKKRNLIMRRYKKVKFVEAKKAERRLKAAQKALSQANNNEDKVKLKEAVHVAEVDRNYAKFCPLGWKYVSLYATGDIVDEDEEGRREKGDPEMWKRVESTAGDKGALNRLYLEMPIQIRLTDEVNLEMTAEKAAAVAGEEDDDEDDDLEFFS